MIICLEKPNCKHFTENLSKFGVSNHIIVDVNGKFKSNWMHNDVENYLLHENPKVYVINDEEVEEEVLKNIRKPYKSWKYGSREMSSNYEDQWDE